MEILKTTTPGATVEMVPEDYVSYSSTYRPDLVARMMGRGGMAFVGDAKLCCPHATDPTLTHHRGSMVGFGSARSLPWS